MKKLFPRQTIIRTKYFDVHQDWEVPIPGFFIIASVRSVKSISEFNQEEIKEFARLLFKMRQGMKKTLNVNKVYLFQDESSSHNFHLWILPIYSWMNEFGLKIESIRPIINYSKSKMKTKEVFEKVKQSVKKMKKYMLKSKL